MLEIDRRNAATWSMLGANGAFGMAVNDLAGQDKDFAVVTADLCFFSGLARMRDNHPDQLYNVGIAEQNMIGIAAGMVKEGMHVFATTYASFAATRVLDQVKVNMGYMKLPVKLVGLTSGFSVGILGATHMGLEDIAVIRTLPGVVILSPADCTETVKCVYAAAKCERPVYLRLTGVSRTPILYEEDYHFEIGKANVLRDGMDVAVFSTGSVTSEALKAAQLLGENGISCAVVNMHTLKPLDLATIRQYAKVKLLVSIEEHSVIGGLGAAIAEAFCGETNWPAQLMIGIEDAYPHAAEYAYLMEQAGLTAVSIAEKIIKKLDGIRS